MSHIFDLWYTEEFNYIEGNENPTTREDGPDMFMKMPPDVFVCSNYEKQKAWNLSWKL